MNSGKICVSVCADSVDAFVEKINSAKNSADIIEIRFDCLSSSDAIELLKHLVPVPNDGKYLFTNRPSNEGGQRAMQLRERLEFWDQAFLTKDPDFLIDVEPEAPILAATKKNSVQRIVSYHSFQPDIADVATAWSTLSALSDGITKVAVTVNDADDAISVWSLVQRAGQDGREIIPIAMGEAGKWTRILGLAHGAFLTYAALESGSEVAPGQISVRDMIDVFRVKELNEETKVYGIIAGNTSYTMSPYVHNAAFKSAGINSVFVPLQVNDLDAFIRRMVKAETREVELNFHGFSVTNPHKQSIICYLDRIDAAAKEIGAVNTVNIVDGKLHGCNTDAGGFIQALKAKLRDLKGSRAAVVGSGGAARACVYALKSAGCDVTVFGRNIEKAKMLATDLDVSAEPLSRGLTAYDIVVNATPLGTKGDNANKTIATAEQLKNVRLVYDLVYNPAETRLLHEAKQAGADTINGFDMFVAQAVNQCKIWTGLEAPVDQMSDAARKRLNES